MFGEANMGILCTILQFLVCLKLFQNEKLKEKFQNEKLKENYD